MQIAIVADVQEAFLKSNTINVFFYVSWQSTQQRWQCVVRHVISSVLFYAALLHEGFSSRKVVKSSGGRPGAGQRQTDVSVQEGSYRFFDKLPRKRGSPPALC